MVGVPDCHDVCVVVDQGIINVVGSKSVHDHGNVGVGAHAVVRKELHGVCNAHVVIHRQDRTTCALLALG